jgi:hypothetical protein
MDLHPETRPEPESAAERGTAAVPRNPYATPALARLGDLRTTCLAGTPGVGDSANPGTRGNLPPPPGG